MTSSGTAAPSFISRNRARPWTSGARTSGDISQQEVIGAWTANRLADELSYLVVRHSNGTSRFPTERQTEIIKPYEANHGAVRYTYTTWTSDDGLIAAVSHGPYSPQGGAFLVNYPTSAESITYSQLLDFDNAFTPATSSGNRLHVSWFLETPAGHTLEPASFGISNDRPPIIPLEAARAKLDEALSAGFPTHIDARERALGVIAALENNAISDAPEIEITADGEISFIWDTERFVGSISFLADGEVLGYASRRDGSPPWLYDSDDWKLRDIAGLLPFLLG